MTTALSTPIAQGRTADVYAWDKHHVLKLYRDWCPPHWVEDEGRIANAIHYAGIPSPAAKEIIEVNGRRGLIYERLEGISMLKDMNMHPWRMFKHARSLAELQVKINKLSMSGLPSYKDGLRYSIESTPHLVDELRRKALKIMDSLPDGNKVCHGDYHPGNVIITKDGPVVIDWMTARLGSPWADVARTVMIFRVAVQAAGKQVSPFIRAAIGSCCQIYLKRYRMLLPDTRNEFNRWLPVIAAARLNEDIPREREALIQMIKEG
jgi:uncharacterized protein (TIGR02172 family)